MDWREEGFKIGMHRQKLPNKRDLFLVSVLRQSYDCFISIIFMPHKHVDEYQRPSLSFVLVSLSFN